MAGYLGPQSCVRDMARSRNCFKITEYQRSVLKVLFESWHKAESGPAPAAHIRDLFVEKSFARHRPGPCRACARPCVPWFDNHWAFCPEQIGARSCSMGGPDCLRDLYPSIFIPSLSLLSPSARLLSVLAACWLMSAPRQAHSASVLASVVPELIFLTFCDAHLQTKWNARTQTKNPGPSRYEVWAMSRSFKWFSRNKECKMSWLMAENCIKLRPRAARLGATFEFHHHTVTFNYPVIFPVGLKIEYSIVIGIDFTVVNVHAPRWDFNESHNWQSLFRESCKIKSSGDRWKRKHWSRKPQNKC